MTEPTFPVNPRRWRFESEADCEGWFISEICNIVLSAWARYPSVTLSQQNKPLSDVNISENVDLTFSSRIGNRRAALVVGESKRNLIDADLWQGGNPSQRGPQKKLSQELRGYVTLVALACHPSMAFIRG